jgi:hypothetical protein
MPPGIIVFVMLATSTIASLVFCNPDLAVKAVCCIIAYRRDRQAAKDLQAMRYNDIRIPR